MICIVLFNDHFLSLLSGEVIGRCIKEVKVCSCPKRDKEKEEKSSKNEKPDLVQKTETIVQMAEDSTKIKFENLSEDMDYVSISIYYEYSNDIPYCIF